MALEMLFSAIAALAVGICIGWFVGSRPLAEWRARHAESEGKCGELTAQLSRMVPELATMSERAARSDKLAEELDAVRQDREALGREVAELRRDAVNFADREKLLIEARDALLKEFQNAGAKVLGEAQRSFLERATERFDHAEKANEARIKALLEPVGAKLSSYEDQVRKLEKERVDAFGNLAGLIEGMRVGQEQIRAEAQRLGASLRNAPKTRGRWGEQQLRNVLEQCGLTEHTDFVTEHSISTDEGRLRPDAIVRIPGNKLLVIDAKVSLNAYQDAVEAIDEDTRNECLDKHVAAMKSHIQTLSAKSYQSQFEEAPDYVVMFVPGEHLISAAIERDARKRTATLNEESLLRIPDLWNFAFERRVLLASPTNLVALARTIAQVWRQDALAREAREIGRFGTELYDRLATAADHLKRVGSGLDSAVNNYNKFVGSFERNVLTAGRRLRDKGIEIGKREIDDVPLVEAAPRYADVEADTPEPPALQLIDPANDEGVRDTG